MNQRFCLDTSVFINAWRKHYRIDVFPVFWRALDGLIERGVLMSCYEVYLELSYQKDELFDWAKQRRAIFEEPREDTTLEYSQLIYNYETFGAAGANRNSADPWVIAHAKLAKAIVVTDEQPARNPKPTKVPKIPNVCDDLGIRWMGPVDFLKEAGIRFD